MIRNIQQKTSKRQAKIFQITRKSLLARARVGAQSGLGPGPGWGPYGPLWALWSHVGPYGPDFAQKLLILRKNHKIINKNMKIVNLEILKVKTWFGDKDLFS